MRHRSSCRRRTKSTVNYDYAVYREPVTGPRSTRSRTGSHYDWPTCGTPTGLWARSLVGAQMDVNNQNGADVQAISNLAIGFPLSLEL